MFNKLGLYITLFCSFNGIAQPYLSVRGDFSVDQRRGCRDLFITATNINPGTDVILYQFEGRGSTVTASNTHNYISTGNFWLYQYIQGPTGQKADSIFIEIFDPILVDFELETCNNNDVLVSIQNVDYDLYEIDYGDGTVIQVPLNGIVPSHHYNSAGPFNITVSGLYTTANSLCGANSNSFNPVNTVLPGNISLVQILDDSRLLINYQLAPNTSSNLEVSLNGNSSFQTFKSLNQNTSTDTLSGLNFNNTYCFRLRSNDACSNYREYSNEVCSINLEVTAVNDAMDLNWQTYYLATFSSLNIYRDGNIIDNLNTPALNYTDSTAICDSIYCYTLEIINSSTPNSTSNTSCEQAFSNTKPAAVNNISTIIDGDIIRWTWLTPTDETVGQYKIFNSDGVVVTNTDQNIFSQEVIEPLNCLAMEFTNGCGIASDLSNLVCPLEVDYKVIGSGITELSWNNYQGWSDGVSGYSVIIFDQNMVQLDSIWNDLNTTYEDPLPTNDNQVSYYQIIASPIDASIDISQSNLLIVERPPIISLPSSFTPNGDGLNDLFEISGKYIMSQELTILNRWGSIVFSSTSNGWDGTKSGVKVAAGNYVYQAKIKDFTGKEHIRTGSVLILKD